MDLKGGIAAITARGWGVLLDNQAVKPRFRATVFADARPPVNFEGDTMEAAIEAAVVGMGLVAALEGE